MGNPHQLISLAVKEFQAKKHEKGISQHEVLNQKASMNLLVRNIGNYRLGV